MTEDNAQIKRPLVLVADDDTTIRILARASLEQAGFTVEEAEDGTQALSAFARFQPDIMLLDVMMPEMDGFCVCASLRKFPGGDFLPVLMMTGMDDTESISRAYDVGATDFVIKPINWTILGNRVKYMLRASQLTGELRRSEAKNRALLNAIPDLMFQINKDGVFLDFKAAKNIDLLVSPSEFKNKKVDEVLPQEVAQQTMQHIERAFQTGDIQVFEYQLLQKEEPRSYEARLVLSGEKEILAIIRDISSRKRAEEALKKSQEQLIQAHKMKALGTLVAGVAHEINGPMNLIKLNTPILQRMWRDVQPVLEECAVNEPARKYGGMTYNFLNENIGQMLYDIDMAVNRVTKIVTNLKNFSKQEKEIETKPIQINVAVDNAVRMAQATLKKSGIAVKTVLEDTLPLIEGDLRSIEQVVLNLIINGLQAIEDESGTITVMTGFEAKKEQVILSVTDTGKGIDLSIADKVFDPFFTDRQADGGTGLGLSITYTLVKAHGGAVTFQSNRGKGTTFTVSLPTIQEKKVLKILVAEDNRLIRETLVNAIAKHRACQVDEASSGIETCIKLGTYLPDLLILNMFMPEMNGLEVCRMIRNEPKLADTKVIIITASPENSAMDEVARLGFTNIHSKPLDIEKFTKVVDETLSTSNT